MWCGANFTASTFATGALGPLVGLGFWDSVAIIIFMNFFAPMLTALFGTFGPMTGLRTIVISRYSFGVWGSRLIVIFNVLTCVGWAAVNSIAGAQILLAISDGKCPLWAGNLIIGVLAMVITIFGYRIVHFYERFAWIPQLIIFSFLAAYGAKHFNVDAYPMGTGSMEVGPALSYISILYGFSAGWAVFSADYNGETFLTLFVQSCETVTETDNDFSLLN
jgi:NCS1 nucleoside transporter family